MGRGTPCAAAMAGERGGASPGRARATSGVRYRLRQLAQKYGGALGVLTVGLDRARERRRVAGDEDRRRGRYGLVEEAKRRVFRRPRLHGAVRGVPAEMLQGSVRPVVRRRLGIKRAARLTGGDSPGRNQRREG